MNSISKEITILRWKSNTQVEIFSRKLTPKCDVTEQRRAVKFVLAQKSFFRCRISSLYMTVYLLFALQAGTYTLKIKFGEIK